MVIGKIFFFPVDHYRRCFWVRLILFYENFASFELTGSFTPSRIHQTRLDNSRIRFADFFVWDTNIWILSTSFYHSRNITEARSKKTNKRSFELTLMILIFFFRNCLRRIMHDDQEFSNQSIMYVIEKFVKTVNSMEETILIPSRLMDRQVNFPQLVALRKFPFMSYSSR